MGLRRRIRSVAQRTFAVGAVAVTLVTALPRDEAAAVEVLTYHNDNARTGRNPAETTLTPANVNPAQFGKLFHQSVDGYVYAQPLYVENVTIAGQVHNVVIVETENDTLYAFDADSRSGINRKPLWKRSLRPPGATAVPSAATQCRDLIPKVGATSTPVIDRATSTIYAVAKTKEHKQYFHRLHAIDLATGAEKLGGPVVIGGSVPGTGDGSVAGMVSFEALRAHQRAALLLANGGVYVAFASHCDVGPYHGWVFRYDAATLAREAMFNVTPNGGLGGIWLAGGGPAADAAGKVYVVTGNGTFDANVGGTGYGDSVVKLSSDLLVEDYFTPFDQQALSQADLDFGSSGAVLLPDQPGPHPHLLVTAGKNGTIYLLDRDDLGHFHPGDDSQIVQSLPHELNLAFDTPAYWNGRLYYQGLGQTLKAFALSAGTLSTVPVDQSLEPFDYPGTTPSISANGTSDGIAWVIRRGANSVLYAYDAMNLSHELYHSTAQATPRLSAGRYVKFTVPTVANGKVYVGAQRRLSVFGLLP